MSLGATIGIPDNAAALPSDEDVRKTVAVPIRNVNSAKQHAICAFSGFLDSFGTVTNESTAGKLIGLRARREQIEVDRVIRRLPSSLRMSPGKIAAFPVAQCFIEVTPVPLRPKLQLARIRINVVDYFGEVLGN